MGEQKERNVSVIKDADGNNIVMINDICFRRDENLYICVYGSADELDEKCLQGDWHREEENGH